MNKKIIFLIMIGLVQWYNIHAQGEADNWFFGINGGLNFATNPPEALWDGKLITMEGCATISDSDGNLLFYTDGTKVWNREHIQMPNGFSLNGNPSSTQSGIIVPYPGNPDLYYVFTVANDGFSGGLQYSIVNMTSDSGKGDVTSKNNLIFTPSTEKIAAVLHANEKDYWLITHRLNTNEFYTFLITSAGIQINTPVISPIGVVHENTWATQRGYLRASPSGKKLALGIESKNIYEIFDFNLNTGAISNNTLIDNKNYEYAYGVEFSFNERYLYASERWGSNLWQFDLEAADIPASAKLIATLSPAGGGALQLGKDKKIYLARANQKYLGVIEDPESANPVYKENGIYIGEINPELRIKGGRSREGLPTFISTIMTKSYISVENRCINTPTFFSAVSTKEVAAVQWNINYPTALPEYLSIKKKFAYTFTVPGKYTAKLTITYADGSSTELMKNYEIFAIPTSDLSMYSSICSGTPIDAGAGYKSYDWNTHATTRSIIAKNPGIYSVVVANENGCKDSTSVNITSILELPEFDLTVDNTSSPGATDGNIFLNLKTDCPDCTYEWLENGVSISTSKNLTNKKAGCYTVTITPATGCKSTGYECIRDSVFCDKKPNFEWAVSGGGIYGDEETNDIATDSEGNVYATGYFRGTVQFGGVSLTAVDEEDIFIAKYDSTGVCIWAKNAGGFDFDRGNSISIDAFDNIYVTGYFYNQAKFGAFTIDSEGQYDVFLAKYDKNGNCIWVQNAGGPDSDDVSSVLTSKSGYIYITGYFKETATFGTELISSTGSTDAFFAKYDNTGKCLWVKKAGSTNFDYGDALSEGIDGNIYLTGHFAGTATFDTLSVSSFGDFDIYTAKYNKDGNCIWVRSGGGTGTDQGYSSISDSEGNVFLTGEFRNTATFGSLQITSHGGSDIFILKYDNDGNEIWLKDAGSTGKDFGTSIAITHQDNLIMTGYFEGTATFDTKDVTSTGQGDIYIVQYDKAGKFQNIQTAGSTSRDTPNSLITFNSDTYIAGTYKSTANFDSHAITSKGASDAFLAKLVENKFRITRMDYASNCLNADICINLEVSDGGEKPYTYLWSTGQTTQDICTSTPGEYYVFVYDNQMCILDSSIVVQGTPTMHSSTEVIDVTTVDGNDGEINLTVEGGLAPYTYSWDNGSTTQDLSNLESGLYTVTISDNLGCVFNTSAYVSEPDNLLFYSITPTNIACDGADFTGKIDLEILNGTPPYTYLWYPDGQTTQDLSNLQPGIYTFFVMDSSTPQMQAMGTAKIKKDVLPFINLGPDLQICGGTNSVLNAQNEGDAYLWSTGATTQEITIFNPGKYYVDVINTCGVSSDTVNVTADFPKDFLGNDKTNCYNSVLDASFPADNYLWSTGETSKTITVNTTGNYNVEATNVCGTFYDTIAVTIIIDPVIELGPPKSECIEATIDAGPGYLSYLWSTGETSQVITVSTTGNYHVTISNMCGTGTDNIDVVLNPPLNYVKLNDTGKFCETTILDADIGADSYKWSTGATSQTITVTSTGNYSITATYSCGKIIDQSYITIVNQPVANLGPDVLGCFNSTIDAGGGDYTYLWSTGETSRTISVNSTGNYTVTKTNICNYAKDDINVEITPPAIYVNLGSDDEVCNSKLLDALPGANSYLWSTGQTSQTITINTTGKYYVTGTYTCGKIADTIFVKVNYSPVLDFGADKYECTQATLNAGIGANSYLWSTGETSQTITVNSTGIYSVTKKNDCGEITKNTSVFINPPPHPLDLGADVEVCFKYTLDADKYAISYQWNTGEKSQTRNITESGFYSVKALFDCGYMTDEVYVKIVNKPVVELGPPVSECIGAILDAGNAGANFRWNTGQTTQTINATHTGNYTVFVTNMCGKANDNVNVTLSPPAHYVELGPDAKVCETKTLDANTGASSYLWSTGETSQIITVNSTGNYKVTGTYSCGEIIDSILVTVLNQPIADLGPDRTECLSASLDAGDGDYTYFWNTSETSRFITVNATGTYSVMKTNLCNSITDNIHIDITPPANSVELGADQNSCSSKILDAGTGASSYLWSTGETSQTITINSTGKYTVTASYSCGEIKDSVNINIIYPPTVDLGSDITHCFSATLDAKGYDCTYLWSTGETSQTITVNSTGKYTVTKYNTCGNVSDEISVSIQPPPIYVNLGADKENCDKQTLDANAGGLSYLWSTGETSRTIQVNSTGNYSVNVLYSCGYISDEVFVNIKHKPNINLGNNISECLTATLDAGPGGDSYMWTTGQTSQIITADKTGTYGVIVINTCGSDMGMVSVTITPPLNYVELGPDDKVCETKVLDANSGAISYLWSTGQTSRTITANSTGKYSVTAEYTCGLISDDINVTVVNQPIVNLGNDITNCFSAVLNAGSGDYTYSWSTGETSSTINVNSTGNYSVSKTNLCNTVTDAIFVTIKPPDVYVELGADQNACESTSLDAGNGANSYIWNTGETTQKIIADKTGTYTVTANYSCGNISDEVFITIIDKPIVEITQDSTDCQSAYINAGNGGTSYLWNTGETTQKIRVKVSGKYSVEVAKACGKATNEINVNITLPQNHLDLGEDRTVCNSQILNAGEGALSYLWNTGEKSSSIIVNKSGKYSVETTYSCGKISDEVKINVSERAELYIGPDKTECLKTELDAGVGAKSYLWNTGETTQKISVKETGKYFIQAEYECGNLSDTISVRIISLPEVNLPKELTGCKKQFIEAETNENRIIWSTGEITKAIEVSENGKYSVEVSNICGSASDTVNVTIDSIPEIAIEKEISSCGNFYIRPYRNSYNISWNTGIKADSLEVSESGIYIFSFQNACGIITDSVNVNLYEKPYLFIGNDTVICNNQTLVLQANAEFDTYVWNEKFPEDEYTVNHTGKYKIDHAGEYTLTATLGPCMVVDTIIIGTTDCQDLLLIPEAFSPNGDGSNDFFKINNIEFFPENSLIIMNRWGKKVYESKPYENDWDGKSSFGISFGGEDLPDGTYYYIFNPGPKQKIVTGSILILRR